MQENHATDRLAFDCAPVDFAAKVRWRIAHDRNALFPVLQDKLAVKSFARQRGVASPEVLWVTNEPDFIPLVQLPATCFIKANHGCGWNILCEQGEFYYFLQGNELLNDDGSFNAAAHKRFHMTPGAMVELCAEMLVTRFNPNEWAYQSIPPKILVEEKLISADGGELLDFRFYTFDGVVRAINVGSASYRRKGENVFLTPDWEPIILSRYKERLPDPLPRRPENLADMLAAAQRLGAGIDFVRIDLYQSSKGVMLGEMTLYPQGGLADTPTACPQFNRWLGEQWRHPLHPAQST